MAAAWNDALAPIFGFKFSHVREFEDAKQDDPQNVITQNAKNNKSESPFGNGCELAFETNRWSNQKSYYRKCRNN